MASLLTQIKVRKDTYENIKNLVLAQGEPGFAHDTGDYAVGDGTNKFSDICFSLKEGVTGNGTSTDNAIARFDGTTGRIIQNSSATIGDNGKLTVVSEEITGSDGLHLSNSNAEIKLQTVAASPTDYGVIQFTTNTDTTKRNLFLDLGVNSFVVGAPTSTPDTTYKVKIDGTVGTTNAITSNGGFIHGNLTVPSGKTKDDYVLLAGGGSKALSEMTYSLPLATSTVRGGLKIGYTSTQDNLALTLSAAEQAYVSLPSRLYASNTTATTNPTHSGYYFYRDESDAGKVFNDTAGSRQAATWVSAYDGNWAAQIGVGYYKDVIAYRRKQGSTTWGNWIELADKQWVKDQGYLTAIPSRIGPDTLGNKVAPNNNHTSGWAYYSDTPGANGLPANVQDAEYLTLGYNNSTWAHQLLFKFNGGGTTGTAYDGKDLYTRIYNQNTNSWSDWYTILTSGNVTSILNDKYVTIDTAQDITGAKTYKAPIKTTAECLGNESSNLQFVVGIKAFASGGDMLWQNASDLVWNNIPKKNLTGAAHSGWTSQDVDAKLIPTMNTIAYWNGAYNSSNSSNLKYSTNGEIVGGSGLTADKIVVGNGGAKVKTSSKGIVSSITATDDNNLPTSKAVAEYVAGYSDGHYSTTSGIPAANNGYLKITINSRTSWMLAFTVRTYQAYTFTDYHISGYNYSTTSPYTWYSPEAFLISEKSGDQKVVYFGHQNEPTTAGYRTLWVAIPAGDYAGVDIIDVTNGYTQIDKNGLFTIEYIALGSSKDTSKLGGALTHTVTARRQAFVDEIIGDTTYGADRGISLVSGKFGHSNTAITAQATKGLYKFSYDAYGHITGTESYTDQNTTYSFTSGTDGFTVTPSGGTAQTVSVATRRISSPDTRDTAIGPDGIAAGIQFDFKTGATANHPTTAGGKYVGVMTWKSYGGTTDYSGGGPLQLSYDEAGVLWTRLGSRSAWGDWHQLATIEDVTSISGAYLPLAGGTMNENATITLPNSAKIVHRTNDTSNYVSDTIWYKGSKAVASGYDAQIGWHNTGDTNGAITILPYATTSEPWSSNVGLYISKTRLKYNGTNISLEGHGHTNMVTGSGLTANNIVVGNNNSSVKISGVSIDTNNNVSIPGKLTVSTGAYISGRAAGGGDDEGLIIGRASNGYAGLILGGATGKRSVLYLMPDTYTTLPTKAVWRYNDGTNQSEIAHPGNSGTIATQEWVTTQLGAGGSGSNSEYAKFLKPQDSATSDGASTWTGSAVAGTWKRGWSQRFKHTGIGSDTGDINFWLRPAAYSSGGTEVCIMIDGDFYGHTGSKRVAYTDELPSVSDKKVSITTDGKGLSGAGSFTLNQNSDTTIKLTLESSASGNRVAERVVIASAEGQIDSEKYAITNDSGTVKATWQYNSSTDCVELVWA
jgi:hypothetical protein